MNGFGGHYSQPPSVWQEHHTPDGKAYYYNNATKVTQWTKPEDLMTPVEVSSLRPVFDPQFPGSD